MRGEVLSLSKGPLAAQLHAQFDHENSLENLMLGLNVQTLIAGTPQKMIGLLLGLQPSL